MANKGMHRSRDLWFTWYPIVTRRGPVMPDVRPLTVLEPAGDCTLERKFKLRFIVATMMVVFFLSGIIFLIVFIRELVRRILRRHHFIRTQGVIVGIRTKTLRTSSRGRLKTTVMHFPVIKFSKQTGEAMTFTSKLDFVQFVAE